MDMSFLKDTIDGVLDQAVEAAHGLIVTAQQVLDDVDEQLDEWADEIRDLADGESANASAGGRDEVSPSSMYDYLVKNSTGRENAHYNSARSFLLSDYGRDALESLYESKMAKKRPLHDLDFSSFDWPDDDWWAGKTDKF